MASLNKVMLIGNTGREAELRYLASGTAKSEFSLAVNYRRRGVSGEYEEATEWFNIVLFGDQAERISQYITKGKPLYIEGRLSTRTWDDDQGVKHYRTEVIANNVLLLGGREGGQGGGNTWEDGEAPAPGGGGYGRGARSAPGREPAARRGGGFGAASPEVDVDDLPFE